jgi:hypothetical protein
MQYHVNKEAPDVMNGLRVPIDNGNDLPFITKERQLHGTIRGFFLRIFEFGFFLSERIFE